MRYIIKNILNLLSGKGDGLKGSDIHLLGETLPTEPEFDREKWSQDYDSKNYPESDKYFEIAQQLLQKYPVEEWNADNGYFPHLLIQHPKCEIKFRYDQFSCDKAQVNFYEIEGALKLSHRYLLAEMFLPVIKRKQLKDRQEIENIKKQKQAQFNTRLAAALS